MKRVISILFLSFLLITIVFAQSAEVKSEAKTQQKAETRENQFQPPEWILGDWSDLFFTTTWEFSETDVLLDDLSFKESYGSAAIVKTSKNDTVYSFSIKIDSTVLAYVFEKVSDGMITYTRYSNGDTDGPQDLYKWDLW